MGGASPFMMSSIIKSAAGDPEAVSEPRAFASMQAPAALLAPYWQDRNSNANDCLSGGAKPFAQLCEDVSDPSVFWNALEPNACGPRQPVS